MGFKGSGEYLGDLESSLMFDDAFDDGDDSDEDPTFEDPTDERSLKKRKRKEDGRGAHFKKQKLDYPSDSWVGTGVNKFSDRIDDHSAIRKSFHNPLQLNGNSHYSTSNAYDGGVVVVNNTESSRKNMNADATASETQVKQLLFEHYQRVSLGSYPRDASLDILKKKIKHNPELVKAFGRIHARATSKPSSIQSNPTRRLQGMQNSQNHLVPSSLGSYLRNPNDQNPNPPIVKQKLNAEMASSLIKGGSSLQSAFQQSFESEVNKVTEEEFEAMSELDKKIYTTLKECESISIRLRHSLQENLQELLETNSLQSVKDDTDDKEKTEESNNSKEEEKEEKEEKLKETEKDKSDGVEEEKKDYIVREQPNMLQLALKEYQLVGLNWLNLLNAENINGILADEMGLGKTIQTISLLALLHERGLPDAPHLIICPSTTLTNWLREIKKWCPAFRVIAYFGNPEERDEIKQALASSRYDIIVTTYNIAGKKRDRIFLKKQLFYYVILDEAQNIKNSRSLRHTSLRKLNSRHRLLLTGTPLQNNLDELWALLQFIMPNLFDFEIDFANEENSGMNDERVNRMKAIMAPFVLRRLKQHVSRDLPPKMESVQLCDMTSLQKELYYSCVQQSRSWWEKLKNTPVEELEDGIISDEEPQPQVELPPKRKRGRPKKNQIPEQPKPPVTRAPVQTLNNVFMQLRKIANHPLLVRTYYTEETIQTIGNYLMTLDEYKKQSKDSIMEDLYLRSDFRIHQLCKEKEALTRFMLSPQQLEGSGKIQLMKNLLQELKADGHRVLIFSQMTRVLDVLEEVLGLWGYQHLRLDGSTPVPERQELIDTYNTDENYFIFLLSTRAGGVGINLTSADSVIFYDIAFNPQVDRQAEDRCHRFGQDKPVTIYKLITSRTVDQNMLQMADRKAKLNDIMLEEGSKRKEQTKVWQLRSLLSSVFEEIQ